MSLSVSHFLIRSAFSLLFLLQISTEDGTIIRKEVFAVLGIPVTTPSATELT
jgi:hypothetical protein